MTVRKREKHDTHSPHGHDLEGKEVLAWVPIMVRAKVTGGFGCKPKLGGSAVFIEILEAVDPTGTTTRIERDDVASIVIPEEDAA